jgi:hypothetical protein
MKTQIIHPHSWVVHPDEPYSMKLVKGRRLVCRRCGLIALELEVLPSEEWECFPLVITDEFE